VYSGHDLLFYKGAYFFLLTPRNSVARHPAPKSATCLGPSPRKAYEFRKTGKCDRHPLMQFPHGTKPSLEQPRHSILCDEHAEPSIQDESLSDSSFQSRLSRIVRGPRAQLGDANRRNRSTISISLVSSAANRSGSELLYAEHQELAKSIAYRSGHYPRRHGGA